VLLSRFYASVRLFASALSGCGHISNRRLVTIDLAGTLAYIAVWTTVGYLVGQRAIDFLGRHRGARLLLLVGPVALATLLAYRLWRRRRYGAARADAVIAESVVCRDARSSG
jgi:membrane protein DedA with SNARE-associated domain